MCQQLYNPLCPLDKDTLMLANFSVLENKVGGILN